MVHGGGNSGQVLARAATLAAELLACVGELPTDTVNSASPPAEVRALSTREVAALLGVSTYTVNEWARLGRLRSRQDSPGGRRHFDAADVAAYKAEHTSGGIAARIAGAYSPPHETNGFKGAPAPARVDASAASGGSPSNPQHGCAVGARRTPRKPARNGRPFAPGSAAWRPPESEG